MLKQIWFIVSVFLIVIIFLRMPQESIRGVEQPGSSLGS
jgi:hypothetical protein